jgi:predicted nuclease of restriction endonuclease-like (RecB) superfamily
MSDLSEKSDFFAEVKSILIQARGSVVRAVNKVMVEAYWQIGKKIVLEEQDGSDKAAYGKEIIKRLSQFLSKEFGKGFSVANLWNMRQFYLTYDDEEILYALRRELSWTHHRSIMRVEDPKARQYYLENCAKENWSSHVLDRQIQTQTYQRLLSTNQASEGVVVTEPTPREQILTQLKDPYVLEFLNLSEDPKVHEKDFETALINDLQKFLLELGGGFSFVARQMRISTAYHSAKRSLF